MQVLFTTTYSVRKSYEKRTIEVLQLPVCLYTIRSSAPPLLSNYKQRLVAIRLELRFIFVERYTTTTLKMKGYPKV